MGVKIPNLVTAAISHYSHQRDRAIANLEPYLSNAVGIGEHSDLTEEVIKLFNELDHAQSVLKTIEQTIVEVVSVSPQPETPAAKKEKGKS